MSEMTERKNLPEGYRPNAAPQVLRAIHGNGRKNGEDGRRPEAADEERREVRHGIADKSCANLLVGPDLQGAAEWYARVLDLPGYTQTDEQRIALRLPAGSQTCVLWRTEHQRPGLNLSLRGNPQPFVTLNVANVDRIHHRVLASGGTSILAPCDLFFRVTVFLDPYGNCLSVIQEPQGWGRQIGRNGPAATLDWVKIPVPGTTEELLRTAEWYHTHLGLAAGELTKEQDGVDLQPGNLHLQLVDKGYAARFESEGRAVPLLMLETTDLDGLYRRMAEMGVVVDSIAYDPALGRRYTCLDPNGNAIGIHQRQQG
jgi:predicted enzyme related to lactoylglutathione lyase